MRLLTAIALLSLSFPLVVQAQDQGCVDGAQSSDVQPDQSAPPDQPGCPSVVSRTFGAVKAYVTSPARWDRTDWEYFGGTLAAIGIASQFDRTVRKDLNANSPVSPGASSPNTVQDALPAAALFVGTWGYAKLIGDDDGVRESHAMLEAATLSLGTAEVLGYIVGRQRPNQTRSPGHWFAGGSSFPSGHATAAFAIGTVLAESGNYRWVRRVLGYGVAGFTAYERLKHDAHWLSDTVAGAALGAASARFAMDRERAPDDSGDLAIAPYDRGVMLTYTVKFN